MATVAISEAYIRKAVSQPTVRGGHVAANLDLMGSNVVRQNMIPNASKVLFVVGTMSAGWIRSGDRYAPRLSEVRKE